MSDSHSPEGQSGDGHRNCHRALFEHSDDAIADVKLDDRRTIRDVNPRFEAVFGRDRDALRGESLVDVVASDTDEPVEGEQPGKEQPIHAEVRRPAVDGGKTFKYRFVPGRERGGNNEATGYAVYTDVTERTERSSARTESERYRKRLYEITSDSGLSDDEKIQRLLELGCERLDVENAHIVHIDPDAGRHEVVRAYGSDLVQEGTVTDLEETYCSKTITSDDILGVYNALEQGWGDDPAYEKWNIGCYVGGKVVVDGKLYGTICFANEAPRDVSFTPEEKVFVDLMSRWVSNVYERREREAELRETNDRLRAIIESSPDGITVLSHDGTVDLWNPAAEDIFGWSEEEVVGESLPIVPNDREEESKELFDRVTRGESVTGVETRRLTKDDDLIDVNLSAAPLLDTDDTVVGIVAILEDITQRKAYERSLRERERELSTLMDNIPGMVYRCMNEQGWPMEFVSDGSEALTGYTPAELESGEVVWGEDILHPADREDMWETVQTAIDAREPFEVTYRIERADGRIRWVWEQGRAVYDGDTPEVLEGVIMDVTDQKEYEQALDTLHGVAYQLLTTEDDQAVANLVVDTAAEVLETSAAALYRLDADANELAPTAYTSEFAERCGGAPSVGVGESDSPLWKTFATDKQRLLDESDTTDGTPLRQTGLEGAFLIPLGEHGVFVVIGESVSDDTEQRQLVETLAATTEAAFERLASEAALRTRDAELEAQNERLQRQIQINEIIRSISQSLIEAVNRADVESTVCERLVEDDSIAFAWIGALDASGERLEPRTWAGTDQSYLDAVDWTDGCEAPSWLTAISEEATVVSNVGNRLQSEPWAADALADGLESVVSVPLTFDEYTYGVLSVYADEPNAFGDLERSVFTELGESIAHSINALETHQALYSETLTEIELRIDTEETFVGTLGADTGCEIDFEGLGTLDKGGARIFFRAIGGESDDIESALTEFHSVAEHNLITESDGECLFEATVERPTLAATLVRHGGRPQSLSADAESVRVTVELPQTTDIREFLEMLEVQYPSVELRSRRDMKRSAAAGVDNPSTVLETLTERQREVLRTAYLAGFFESPRETSAKGLAEMLGVSQPTVSHHLRNGQKRLLARLFDDSRATVS